MSRKGVKRTLEESPSPPLPLEVSRTDVPEYLRKGEFFRSLGEEDNDTFVVPGDAMKSDDTIANAEELVHFLTSVRFWGVDGVVPVVVEFILANPTAPRLKSSLALFEIEYPYLFTLRKLLRNKSADKLQLVLKLGDLDLVKYFLTDDVIAENCKESCKKDFAVMAALFGHLSCLVYLHEKKCSWKSDLIVGAAVQGGSVECLRYVQEQEPKFSEYLTTTAYPEFIKIDQLDCFIHCYHCGAEFTDADDTFASAFLSKGLSTLKYCMDQGVAPSAAVMATAAHSNHVDCVKLLVELECPMDESVCAHAAGRGNLIMLKFLREAGCPWDEDTTYYAAQFKFLACLQFAHEHGCPWDETCYYGLSSDSPVYKYLELHGCPRQA